MKLEDKIATWVEETLVEETAEDEHYDVETSVRYIKGTSRTRLVVTSHIIMYICGGIEHMIATIALDHPDQDIVTSVIQDAMDCLRTVGQGSASLREVEDILELLDEDDDDE